MKATSSAILRHLNGGVDPFSTGFHSEGFKVSLFGLPVAANRVQELTCKCIDVLNHNQSVHGMFFQ